MRMPWARRPRSRFLRDVSPEKTLDSRDRFLNSEFQRNPDHSAEFYAKALAMALDIALRTRRPMLVVYHVSIVVLVGAALAFLGWITLQVTDRALPVKDVQIEPLVTAAPPLGHVKVRYSLDRLKPCGVDISAIVFDGADQVHPLVTLHRDVSGPTGPDHFTRSFEVPADAVPGKGRLRVAWAYACPGNYAQALSPVPLPFADIPITIQP